MKLSRFVLPVAAMVTALVVDGSTAAAGGEFNLVVNKGNPTASLSQSEVKQLLTGGTKVWGGGAVVHVGLIASEAPETQYLASLMEISVREVFELIQQQVFKGELRRPAVLRSSNDCIAFAMTNPGAFCVAASGVPVPDGARVVPLR